jgi:hypothetical protein
VVLTAYEKGEATAIATRQLGPALAFERLWRETGCKQVISALAAEREFQFDLERAVFLTVLHRLFDLGSDRAAEKWRHGLVVDGVAGLDLHSSAGRWAGLATNWPTRADAAYDNRDPRRDLYLVIVIGCTGPEMKR